MTIGHETYKAAGLQLGLRLDPPEDVIFGDKLTLDGEIAGIPLLVSQW